MSIQNDVSDDTPEKKHSDASKNIETYNPSVSIKRSYLPLHKTGKEMQGIKKLPGLFGCDKGAGIFSNKAYFYISLVLEIATLTLLFVLVLSRGYLGLVQNISLLVVFLIADYLCSGLHHLSKMSECEIENRKFLFLKGLRDKDNSNLSYDSYIKKLNIRAPKKIWSKIGLIFIWVIAAFKIASFIGLALGSKLFFVFAKSTVHKIIAFALITTCYIIIAYIHTKYTGYAIYRGVNFFGEKWEKDRLYGDIKSENIIPIQRDIDLAVFINELENDPHSDCKEICKLKTHIREGLKTNKEMDKYHFDKSFPHEILLKNETKGIFVLKANGFLRDEQLFAMIEAQPNPLAKAVIAIYGISIQLESLSTQV